MVKTSKTQIMVACMIFFNTRNLRPPSFGSFRAKSLTYCTRSLPAERRSTSRNSGVAPLRRWRCSHWKSLCNTTYYPTLYARAKFEQSQPIDCLANSIQSHCEAGLEKSIIAWLAFPARWAARSVFGRSSASSSHSGRYSNW